MNLDDEARALVTWMKQQRRALGYDDILSEARRRNTGAQAADLRHVVDKAIMMIALEPLIK